MNVTLRQLRAFLAVTSAGSFTLAARQLHLTQSAVSMLVQQLERELGLKVLDRSGGAIVPTQAGLEMLPLARRLLDDLRQLEHGANDLRLLRRGYLRVAAPQLLVCTWLKNLLVDPSLQSIEIRILDGTPDDIVGRVRRGEAELGVGPERPVGDDVTRSFLMRVPIHFVCAHAHPMATRPALAWQDICNERWIVYSGEFNRYLEGVLHAHDAALSLPTGSEVEYLTTALALVGAGKGVCAVPAYAASFADLFGLSFVPLVPAVSREYFVYQRRGSSLSLPAENFVRLLHAARASE